MPGEKGTSMFISENYLKNLAILRNVDPKDVLCQIIREEIEQYRRETEPDYDRQCREAALKAEAAKLGIEIEIKPAVAKESS